MNQHHTVSIICPMYNEEAGIENAISKLKECIDDLPNPAEILLINDGSTDRTISKAIHAIAGDRRFRILSHRVNFGRGRALRTGFGEAKGEFIVTTEGDLSWGKDIIGRMVEALENNPGLDAVFASPHLPGGGYRNVPWHRVFLSSFGNRILRFFYTRNVSMTTGMTRAYRAKLIQSHAFMQDGKEIHLEISHRLLMLGSRIGEVPAILSWPDREPGRVGRGKRTNWAKILKLISSHLAFGIFRGISNIIGPTIFLLTLAIVFFGTWAIVNLIDHQPSIYLVTLSGVLLILWVTLILGYILIYHSLQLQREVWLTQSMLGNFLQAQGYTPYTRQYYEEVDIHTFLDNSVVSQQRLSR